MTGNENDTTVQQSELILSRRLNTLKMIIAHPSEMWNDPSNVNALHYHLMHDGEFEITNSKLLRGVKIKENKDARTRKVIIIFNTYSIIQQEKELPLRKTFVSNLVSKVSSKNTGNLNF